MMEGGLRPLRLSQPVGRDRRDPHRLPDLVRRPRPESPPLQGEGWVGMGFPSAPGKFRVPAPKPIPTPALPLKGRGPKPFKRKRHLGSQIGRASWRDRVCQYVCSSVVAVTLKKKKMKNI